MPAADSHGVRQIPRVDSRSVSARHETSHAGHASCKASPCQPGSALQGTARKVGGNAAGDGAGGVGAGVGVGVGVGAGLGGGAVAQPAMSIAAAVAQIRERKSAMEWILLEALVALVIGVGIVWWTMAPSRRKRRGDDTKER